MLFPIGASVADREFTAIYEDKLHDNIVSAIKAALSGYKWKWALNVFRLGFNPVRLKNPITIFLDVSGGVISGDAACKIVSDILALVAAVHLWSEMQP